MKTIISQKWNHNKYKKHILRLFPHSSHIPDCLWWVCAMLFIALFRFYTFYPTAKRATSQREALCLHSHTMLWFTDGLCMLKLSDCKHCNPNMEWKTSGPENTSAPQKPHEKQQKRHIKATEIYRRVPVWGGATPEHLITSYDFHWGETATSKSVTCTQNWKQSHSRYHIAISVAIPETFTLIL